MNGLNLKRLLGLRETSFEQVEADGCNRKDKADEKAISPLPVDNHVLEWYSPSITTDSTCLASTCKALATLA